MLNKKTLNQIQKLVDDGYQLKTKTKCQMNLVTLKAIEMLFVVWGTSFERIDQIRIDFFSGSFIQVHYSEKYWNASRIIVIRENEIQQVVKIIMGNKFVERNGQ